MSKWMYLGLTAVLIAVTVWFVDIAARASYEDEIARYLAKPLQERKTDNPFAVPASREVERIYQNGPPPTTENTSERVWRIGGGIIVLELVAGTGLYVVLQKQGAII